MDTNRSMQLRERRVCILHTRCHGRGLVAHSSILDSKTLAKYGTTPCTRRIAAVIQGHSIDRRYRHQLTRSFHARDGIRLSSSVIMGQLALGKCMAALQQSTKDYLQGGPESKPTITVSTAVPANYHNFSHI